MKFSMLALAATALAAVQGFSVSPASVRQVWYFKKWRRCLWMMDFADSRLLLTPIRFECHAVVYLL